MLQLCVEQLIEGKHLSEKQTEAAFDEIVQGADEKLIAALLVLLRAKGETTAEVTGIVKSLAKAMVPVPIKNDVLDIVGTGGDGANTINISTAASILAASCGVVVAKHGNRSVSSKCGSSDVLQSLGIQLDLTPQQVANCINQIGIGFCFAPNFHPALKQVKAIRAALGVRTVLNFVGPLMNPARANYAVIGVYSDSKLPLMANVLQNLSIKHALIVHGNGLDELNLLGPNHIIEITEQGQKAYRLDPKDFGFSYGTLPDIQGGNVHENTQLLQRVFDGEKGPIADTIALNAGAGLYAADQVSTIAEGVAFAQKQLANGMALKKLNAWISFCREVSHA